MPVSGRSCGPAIDPSATHCSGIGYPLVEQVININADLADLTHYNRTLAQQGEIGAVVAQLLSALDAVAHIEDLTPLLGSLSTASRDFH